jgi:antitoxin (DNA-binding transcriptional repressor) of toxin-antitoxin stability system
MKHRVVNVTEFKATCLALLDEIGERGGTITITKRGRPLATVGPPRRAAWKCPEGSWIGKVTIAGDIVGMETSELWDVLGEQSEALG